MPKAEVLNNCCEGTGDGQPIETLVKADASSHLSSEHMGFWNWSWESMWKNPLNRKIGLVISTEF